MTKLAVKGGEKIRAKLFPNQSTIREEEHAAVKRVLDSTLLTGYQGNASAAFYGGPEVRALEEEWAAKFKVKHAIAINSATSGLVVACKAADILRTQRRDAPFAQAAVSNFSMSCSVTAPMDAYYKPQFTDIEPEHFCMNPITISKYASLLVPVDIFGQPCNYKHLTMIADGEAFIVEDAAQALGAQHISSGRYAGTFGDIGVFSLNQGKHITCGEGGIMVTDRDDCAEVCRLLMNHAEAVIGDHHQKQQALRYAPFNIYGFNLRMTEIQAAIAREQLKKFDELLRWRLDNVAFLQRELGKLPFIKVPPVREGYTHTYYIMPLLFDMREAGVHRNLFIEAVKAELAPVEGREWEGVPIGNGYTKPLQTLPLFQEQLESTPVATRIWRDELVIIHRLIGPNATRESLADVVRAFEKVAENVNELR